MSMRKGAEGGVGFEDPVLECLAPGHWCPFFARKRSHPEYPVCFSAGVVASAAYGTVSTLERGGSMGLSIGTRRCHS